MSSDGLPPSGAWSGYYTYWTFHSFHRMQLRLTFSLNGLIDGDGVDDIQQFTIRGEFEPATRQARWTKAYIGMHSVEYEGVYDGRNILGVWTLAGGSGAFRRVLSALICRWRFFQSKGSCSTLSGGGSRYSCS